MDLLRIRGGKPLQGMVKAQGAKNVLSKLLVASLLSEKRCTFFNVPDVGDVELTIEMCTELGMQASWDRKEGVLEVITKELKTSYIPQRFSGSNRIPILMIGALLGRTEEEIIVPTINEAPTSSSPVNFHIDALKALGAEVEYRQMKKEGAYFACAAQGLRGTSIVLPYPSVGATENAILASVTARGSTTIKNAATEPEILELILFLQKLGAIILIDTDRTIKIQGTRHFHEIEHIIIPDRIEAASLGMAAIATKGKVFVEGADHQSMIAFLNRLREIGGGFTVRRDGIEFFYEGPLQGGIHLETDAYPGFMTDWQPPFAVLLTQATGSSVIHETVYENRFGYADALNEMGADISLFNQCLGGRECRFASHGSPHSAVVKGPTLLHGKKIEIPDLRASFAYVMAGVVASGTTFISGLQFLDRSFENLPQKLSILGADAERIRFENNQEFFAFEEAAITKET
jgi:UDP-N-acetylglucosamine 1-carboxyvinyltransferase